MGILDKIKNAWNAFKNYDETATIKYPIGTSYSFNPSRPLLSVINERSIVSAIYNRIAVDCTLIDICHVRLDENGRYKEIIKSPLNNCLSVEANIDQTARSFMMDAVLSMFDEGYIALVPIDTDRDPKQGTYDIFTMRVGKITGWYPRHVDIEVYDDRDGNRKKLTKSKEEVAIIENPLYSIMNEKNSVLQRLIRKLNLLDAIDEQTGSGKLDLIIQLPYIIKSDKRKEEAEKRRSDLQTQLATSKYGVAYTDGTEKITQLNRPVENNVLKSVEYLTSMLYSQLGITISILDGSADEKTMNNYLQRTVIPIVQAITEEISRKFLTQTARTQGQSITFFQNPFRAIPVTMIADIADKFTRNEILTSNEVRSIIGYKPSDDPGADELRNKNLNKQEDPNQQAEKPVEEDNNLEEGGKNQNG